MSNLNRGISTPDIEPPSGSLWPARDFGRFEDVSGSGWSSSELSTPLQRSRLLNESQSPARSSSPSLTSLSDLDGLEHALGDLKTWVQEETKLSELAESLPAEILAQILQHVPPKDLVSAMLVSKSWCFAAFHLLWQKPQLTSITQFADFIRVITSPSPLLPYASTVRRLSFNGFSKHLSDRLFRDIVVCKNLERVTMPGATNLSASALCEVFTSLEELIAIDLSGVTAVDDSVVSIIASKCRRVQGLNLSKCNKIGDEGLLAIARQLKMLRRIKLMGCIRLTDRSMVALTRSCPLLLELDLAHVPQLSTDTTLSIFFNCANLRELRMNDNQNLGQNAVPDLEVAGAADEDGLYDIVGAYPWYFLDVPSPKAMWRTSSRPLSVSLNQLRPACKSFEQLRVIDFTSCLSLGDESIEHLVNNAPQLRNLTLAKCSNLTDESIDSITRLGKHLHHLHLGHVSSVTNAAIVRLARTCTRLRYIDLANCSLLGDVSVVALATYLPKLRRIGLVKVTNVSDLAIRTLAERSATLERVHLSYCEKITVPAVAYLLNKLPHLTHLSVTGIAAFRTPELQQFCRTAPEGFNPRQRASFCVYSGHGVIALRNYLNFQAAQAGSSSEASSTRRGSTSSTSSVTLGHLPSPPDAREGQQELMISNLPPHLGHTFSNGNHPGSEGYAGSLPSALSTLTPSSRLVRSVHTNAELNVHTVSASSSPHDPDSQGNRSSHNPH